MDEFDKVYTAYKLKFVERKGQVGDRFESGAEHIYSSIFLANYFLKQLPNLDELKVFKMLLYHDFPEIHAGDTFILDSQDKFSKEEKRKKEKEAMLKLENELPKEIYKEAKELWEEFEKSKTNEAKFCKAIDALDGVIHYQERPDLWLKQGFNETLLRKIKEPYLKPFPVMLDFFNDLIKKLIKNGTIPK